MPGQQSIQDYQVRLSNLERDLAKVMEENRKTEKLRDAVEMVMENYSSITSVSREPVCMALKRKSNEMSVLRLVVSLNNLKKQFDKLGSNS